MMIKSLLIVLSSATSLFQFVQCFHPPAFVATTKRRNGAKLYSSSNTAAQEATPSSIADYLVAVVAPLKYVGPYACLGLRFPSHNATLGFLLDTGATVNSIDQRVVKKLDLPLVESYSFNDSNNMMPAIGTGGALNKAGDLYLLGDCELDGLPPEFTTTTFMRNVTAAALPLASPVGHGLLGRNFLMSFPAGVEFDWYGTDGDEPTYIFYYGKDIHESEKAKVLENTTRVSLQQLDFGLLSFSNLKVNGVHMPVAILDTGSPITVFNRAAAKLAGIKTVKSSRNKSDSEGQQQHLGDDELKVAGVDGSAMNLHRSKEKVKITANDFSFGDGHNVYEGELPGLKLMAQVSSAVSGGGISKDVEEPPIVVVGLDTLKQSYRMILKTSLSTNEVLFEALGDQPRYDESKAA